MTNTNISLSGGGIATISDAATDKLRESLAYLVAFTIGWQE